MAFDSSVTDRNNVKVFGSGQKTILLAHGFGCDQGMWRYLLPMLQNNYKLILFDYVGCGQSDYASYDKDRYSSLQGYAKDIIEICTELALSDIIFIGHSVSSMIGTHAAIMNPSLFSHMIMVCPSPCFLNLSPEYMGGFEKEDLEELLNLMDKNYLGWANYLAPLVMGQGNDYDLIEELEKSFCSTDPKYAKPFAKATFFADDRLALPKLRVPTLILQSSNDNLAPPEIGRYMQEQIPCSQLIIVEGNGHCLHMTQPEDVYNAFVRFIH